MVPLLHSKYIRSANTMLLVFSLSFPVTTLAQTPPKAQKPQQLSKIVVKAKHIPPKPPATFTESLIRQSEMKKEQQSMVTDTLRTIPGLTLSQSGGEGQSASLFVRGLNSDGTEFRRDGMKLPGMTIHNNAFNPGTLGTFDLSSMRVLRGPVTSLYGADVIGGLILMDTPYGSGPMVKKLNMEGGSRQSFKVNGELSGSVNRTSVYMNINRTITGGYKQTPHKYQRPHGRYPALPFHQTTGTFRFDQRANESTTLSLINRLSDSTFKAENLYLGKAYHSHQQDRFHRLLVHNKTNSAEYLAGVGYVNAKANYDEKSPFQFRTDQSAFQIDGQATWIITPHNKIALSADFNQNQLHKSEKGTPSFHTKGHQYGAGLHYAWQNEWGGRKIAFNTSGRVDYLLKNKVYPTYRVSAGYEILPLAYGQTWLILNQGTAIKTPTLYQRYAQTPFFKGNRHLKSETLQSYEIALKRTWNPQFQTEATYFYNRVKNIIIGKPVGPYWTSCNSDRAKTQGVETLLTFKITPFLTAEGNYTYTQAKDLSNNQILLRRPFNKWSGQLAYEQKDVFYAINILYVGKRRDITPLTNKQTWAKGYAQVDLKAHKYFTPQTKIYGRIENVLNNQTQDPLGYKRPAIGIFIGLETKFE